MAFEWFHTAPKTKDPSGFQAALVPVFSETGQEFIRDLVMQNLSGRHGDMGLNRRSGNLSRGWQSVTVSRSNGIDLRIWIAGPAAKYAAAEEFGAEIKPVNARFLWLPTPANQDPTGNAKITPREAIARGGFISWGGRGSLAPMTFYATPLRSVRGKKNGPYLEALFRLRKSVKIPARMGATTMFTQKMEQLGAKIAFVAGEYV